MESELEEILRRSGRMLGVKISFRLWKIQAFYSDYEGFNWAFHSDYMKYSSILFRLWKIQAFYSDYEGFKQFIQIMKDSSILFRLWKIQAFHSDYIKYSSISVRLWKIRAFYSDYEGFKHFRSNYERFLGFAQIDKTDRLYQSPIQTFCRGTKKITKPLWCVCVWVRL